MSTEVLDVAALRRNFDDDIEFVGRLMGKFQSRYPAQMTELVDAIARQDGNGAAEAAHRLAGETGVFYATTARCTALEVEELARAGRFAEAGDACEMLRREIERLVSTVRTLPATFTPDSSTPA